MKRIFVIGVCVFAVGQVHAQVDIAKAQGIASKNMCFSCHAADHTVVGPAYRDVAEKYKGNPNAMAMLMKKVKNGGSGVWGTVQMPPNPGINDADLKVVLTWVLAGAPKQ